MAKLVIGTRESELAMIQTCHVKELLNKHHPKLDIEIVGKTTKGDQILDKALSKIGDKGLFTKELEFSLESGEVDVVVHSLKDLPTRLSPNLVIGAILKRVDPSDAVILRKDSPYKTLSELPAGSVIGTSSVRRAAQLAAQYPQLRLQDIRGNLNTRLRKLDAEDGPYSAIILAVAGVQRMKWNDRISQILPPSTCLHAVGQGALAVECRENDLRTLELLKPLQHWPTVLACISERAFMHRLEGGCSAPVAAHGEVDPELKLLKIEGGAWSLDGKQECRDKKQVQFESKSEQDFTEKTSFGSVAAVEKAYEERMSLAESLGRELANDLLKKGAGPMLLEAKQLNEKK